jgi:hypothetical protein
MSKRGKKVCLEQDRRSLTEPVRPICRVAHRGVQILGEQDVLVERTAAARASEFRDGRTPPGREPVRVAGARRSLLAGEPDRSIAHQEGHLEQEDFRPARDGAPRGRFSGADVSDEENRPIIRNIDR